MGNKAFVSQNIDIDDWFTEVVGIQEHEFCALNEEERGRFFKVKDNRIYLRKGGGDGDEVRKGDVCCGSFNVQTLEDLNRNCQDKEVDGRKSCKIMFRTRSDMSDESIKRVDVCTLQSLEENRGCVFQVVLMTLVM